MIKKVLFDRSNVIFSMTKLVVYLILQNVYNNQAKERLSRNWKRNSRVTNMTTGSGDNASNSQFDTDRHLISVIGEQVNPVKSNKNK